MEPKLGFERRFFCWGTVATASLIDGAVRPFETRFRTQFFEFSSRPFSISADQRNHIWILKLDCGVLLTLCLLVFFSGFLFLFGFVKMGSYLCLGKCTSPSNILGTMTG